MATIKFEMLNDETESVEVALPAKYAVCGRCDGEGKHVNPAIDGNGLSREDFEQDPDFEEGYFRGDYDVACQDCKGRTTVLEVDEEACRRQGLGKELEAYWQARRDERAYLREVEAERRMGA